MFHASEAANRSSISVRGLDWRRMGAAPGIAGSLTPETDGIYFTATLDEARFFVHLRSDLMVDVRAIEIDGLPVEQQPDGWWVCRVPIAPERLRRVEGSVTGATGNAASGAAE